MATASPPPASDRDIAHVSAPPNVDVRKLRWGCLVAAGFAVIGALGPWRNAFGGLITVHGTDDGGDGVAVIILAGLYALAIGRHFSAPKRWLAIAAAIFSALIVVIAIADYSSL
jgi:hypothetical protein